MSDQLFYTILLVVGVPLVGALWQFGCCAGAEAFDKALHAYRRRAWGRG